MRRFSITIWFVQMVIALPIPLVGTVLIAAYTPGVDPGVTQYIYIVFWAAGPLASGYLIPPLMAQGPEHAHWTWVLPVICVLSFLALAAYSGALERNLRELFWPLPELNGVADGLAGWALITLPTLSSALYSIGAVIYSRSRSRRLPPPTVG
jgi:hypothetical protein